MERRKKQRQSVLAYARDWVRLGYNYSRSFKLAFFFDIYSKDSYERENLSNLFTYKLKVVELLSLILLMLSSLILLTLLSILLSLLLISSMSSSLILLTLLSILLSLLLISSMPSSLILLMLLLRLVEMYYQLMNNYKII